MATQQFKTFTTTIPSGESVSEVIDTEGLTLAAVYMPSAWTAADMTFAGASKHLNDPVPEPFLGIWKDDGTEYTITVTVDIIVALDGAAFSIAPVRFIRLRSGTTATPVVQAADREIKLLMK